MQTHSPQQRELCPAVRSPASAGETSVRATHNRRNLPTVCFIGWANWSWAVHSPASILANKGDENGVTRDKQFRSYLIFLAGTAGD